MNRDSDRREAVRALARRRKAEKPSSTPGPIGTSAMDHFRGTVENTLRRAAWEPADTESGIDWQAVRQALGE